ncbi:MoaF N-terminal domain-containing protein [Polaromonas sp.]|uniref:MoaF N-terminal domain-containing protein n=1 Tax=Polaromonas sp. TaxID=1869339 RepID=UPI0024893339|nr:MoaF N-terminal domain-containing protein [Polaromonas sp.]MDI1272183.1 MoaF N-terminal domain-containing protein [Polaromonas sp.]
MTNPNSPESLKGKTLRWSFADGPTAGMTFEHSFKQDGSVAWRTAGKEGKSTRVDKCATVRVDDSVFAVSYLGGSGYTLTVLLNFRNNEAIAFGSNDKEWSQQKGSFEVVD